MEDTCAPEITFSPIKAKRLDEKASLQNLNGRLSNYVLRVKEMEEGKVFAEKQLQLIRDRMEKDHSAEVTRLKKELNDCREDLNHEQDQRTRLQVLETTQHTELTQLRTELKDLSEAKIHADRLEGELTQMTKVCQNSKKALQTETTELNALRRRFKTMEKETRKINQQLHDSESELTVLRAEHKKLSEGRDTVITSVRKELIVSHKNEIRQLKKEADDREEKTKRELKTYYEGMIADKTKATIELEEELSTTKSDLERLLSDFDEAIKARSTLAEKVSNLEKTYRDERNHWRDEKKKLDAMLSNLRQMRALKEQEFNQLMDVKIALDAEIQAYRQILDSEEVRVGLPLMEITGAKSKTPGVTSSSSKKRKPDFMAQGALSAEKRLKAGLGSVVDVQVLRLDVQKQMCEIKNCSMKPVTLENLVLKSYATREAFKIPKNTTLDAQASLVVYAGKNNKPSAAAKKQNCCVWNKKYLFNKDGDIACLFTGDDELIHYRCEGMEFEEEENVDPVQKTEQAMLEQQNGCMIM